LVGKPEKNRERLRPTLDSCDSGQGPLANPCEDGNEPLGSIKGREFLE